MMRTLRRMLGAVRAVIRRRRAVSLINRTEIDAMDDQWIERVRFLWGNGGFVARASYVKLLIERGRQLRPGDRVLDVGSGLSTLILNRICHTTGAELFSLEHHPAWSRAMRRFPGLDQVVIHAPLVSYGDYDWYAVPPRIAALSFQLAAVDGPPEKTTRGSRYGLIPCLMRNLSGATVIVDDFRPAKPWVGRWMADFGIRFAPRGEVVAEVILPAKSGAAVNA